MDDALTVSAGFFAAGLSADAPLDEPDSLDAEEDEPESPDDFSLSLLPPSAETTPFFLLSVR